MRRVVLALSLALAVLAVPAVAQTDDVGATNLQSNETVQETRTNPSAGINSPQGGLTITGTVESWNDEEIVIRTTTGVEHLVLQSTTQRPSTFTVGETVSIDYLRSTQNGVMIAQQIRPGGAPAVGVGTADVESNLEQEVEETVADVGEAADDVGAALSEVDDEVEEEIEEGLGTNLDNDDTIGEQADLDNDDDTTTSLPATAGQSPLVALFGLLALGAAAGLRRLF